ncbi:MAG: hypothetical protein FWG04_04625 [Desulfovibrionaceae bacterium]|nr:hypothetical protein [Desulfovibrionaceae bacterium]
MSAEHTIHVIYRAKATCHIGGLREPGELFRWERFDPCPKHLEEVDDGAVVPEAGRKADSPPPVARPSGVACGNVQFRHPAELSGPTLEDMTAGAASSLPVKALKTKNK